MLTMVTRYYLIQCQRGPNITNNPNRTLQTNNYITVINHPQQKDGIVTEQEEKQNNPVTSFCRRRHHHLLKTAIKTSSSAIAERPHCTVGQFWTKYKWKMIVFTKRCRCQKTKSIVLIHDKFQLEGEFPHKPFFVSQN